MCLLCPWLKFFLFFEEQTVWGFGALRKMLRSKVKKIRMTVRNAQECSEGLKKQFLVSECLEGLWKKVKWRVMTGSCQEKEQAEEVKEENGEGCA